VDVEKKDMFGPTTKHYQQA